MMIPSHQQGPSSVGYRRPLSHSLAVSYQEPAIKSSIGGWQQTIAKKATVKSTAWRRQRAVRLVNRW
jgi:hypothetical protein